MCLRATHAAIEAAITVAYGATSLEDELRRRILGDTSGDAERVRLVARYAVTGA